MQTTEMAERLRSLRKASGKSINQITKTSGLYTSAIWRMERGISTNPELNTLRKLAAVYSTTVAFIIGESR